MKIKELLEKGIVVLKENNIEEYILKTRMLASNILGRSKEYLIIHDEDEVEPEKEKNFFENIEKLKLGVPIQYVINKQEFMGLNFFVNENVLIPQPDTEILVQEILEIVKPNSRVLDLCTGSGAIGISLKYLKNDLDVSLSDISLGALEVAKCNARNNNVSVEIINSNLFQNISGVFDIIVSNPPYIETDVIKSLSKEVKCEPALALDGGIDGLDFYRKISNQAKSFLVPGGILGLEIGYNQKEAVINILKKDGYTNIYSKKDYGENDRIIICKRG